MRYGKHSNSPLLEKGLEPWVAQIEIQLMITTSQIHYVRVEWTAATEDRCCRTADQKDSLWLGSLQRFQKKIAAIPDFFRCGSAIPFRSAADDVGAPVLIPPNQAERLQQPMQGASGSPDESTTLHILVRARSLSNDQQRQMEHRVRHVR
ncbi:hypothetical protein BAE27_02400 [Acidithiobacillus caldus]|uniref:Uncharacterized protein n=1 Tax=Acidithiobacillus caldus TaxID=33059 RepID=A0A1E7YQ76_9PROT|nr:hypothetical protein BAE27_02400 [Acidithiobacillus caldus]